MKNELKKIAIEKGYATVKRHIFLCTHGKCSPNEEANDLWAHLKNKLKEIEPDFSKATIARSKVGCLRICEGGTVALVYPEGTLYHGLDKDKLDRIIDEHLLKGKPVKEYIFSTTPL